MKSSVVPQRPPLLRDGRSWRWSEASQTINLTYSRLNRLGRGGGRGTGTSGSSWLSARRTLISASAALHREKMKWGLDRDQKGRICPCPKHAKLSLRPLQASSRESLIALESSAYRHNDFGSHNTSARARQTRMQTQADGQTDTQADTVGEA